jgi:hypothetical protein
MTRAIRNFWIIAALFAAGCGGVVTGPRQQVVVERKWPAAEIERLRVSEVGGNITVDATGTSEITLARRSISAFCGTTMTSRSTTS